MPCNSTKAHFSSAAWPLVDLDNKAYRDFLESETRQPTLWTRGGNIYQAAWAVVVIPVANSNPTNAFGVVSVLYADRRMKRQR